MWSWWIPAGLSALIWLYLALGRGRFWRTSITLPETDDAAGNTVEWPAVTAIVPARDEADLLPHTLPTLLAQQYPGEFRVVLVDDESTDGTGDIARSLGATVVRTAGPMPGWVGKVAAQQAGVAAVSSAEPESQPEWLLFTDADIAYPPTALVKLVRAATRHNLDLVSQMVRLRAVSFWERWLVPAFVYFFAQLYPFAKVNAAGRVAAAAGGCMLVRRVALERAGGLAGIRSELIDDVALGRLLARRGRVWLGLGWDIRSVRAYPRLHDLWAMVARSAYHQLRYSPLLLAATVIGLLLVYAVPPVALVVGIARGDGMLAALGAGGWALMSATYLPMLLRYRVGWWPAPALPLIALMYTAMTVDSARRHWIGRGGAWKGRVSVRR